VVVEQDLYRQTIRESDEAFREATRGLGLLLANHLLSAVDAAITERISRTGRPVELETGVRQASSWDPSFTFTATVRVGF
jgi:hypothetical protein